VEYFLIHASDLHLAEWINNEEKIKQLISEVNDYSPNLLVITGDSTHHGLEQQILEIKELLDEIICPKIIIPGNHDAKSWGWKFFEEYIGPRKIKYEDNYVTLLAMDSSTPDLAEGHIGRENYPIIEETFANSNGKIKIFASHHHLVPVPQTGREKAVLTDSGDVLEILIKTGVNLSLCGHRHVPWVWQLEKMVINHTGTVGSLRIRGARENYYSLLQIKDQEIDISLKAVGGKEKVFKEAFFNKTLKKSCPIKIYTP